MPVNTKFRFYVYRLFDDAGETLYVGKGSGNRLSSQKSAHRCKGEILEGHRRERDAYRRERDFIAELKPLRNRHPGGNGSIATPIRARRKYGWEKEIERIGSRCYAARELLRFDLSGYLDRSKIEAIRLVAYG